MMSHKSFFADFPDDWAHPSRCALALAIQALLFVMREMAAQFPDDILLHILLSELLQSTDYHWKQRRENARASRRRSRSTSGSERTRCCGRPTSSPPPRGVNATNRLEGTKPMAIKRPWNRAKIFQPFDALPGLRELLREKEREHEARYDAIGNESEEGDEDVEIPLASDTLLDYDESNQKFQREEMTFMEFHVSDEHVYLTNERGELLANVDFRETAPGVFDIYHTVVLPELRGQGIAAKLVAKTVEEIHRRGGKVTATCTYAKVWLKRHPQEEDSIQ